MSNSKKQSIPGHTKHLGTRLLAYILNIDEEQVENLERDGTLTPQQKATLDEMERILFRVKQDRTQNMVLQWGDAERLAEILIPGGTSIFNSLRTQNGGDPQPIVSDDPAKEALSEMCVECFPCTLIPRTHDEPGFQRISFPRFSGTEMFGKFLSAVRVDEDLMNLFPDGIDDEFVASRRFYTSFGYGGAVQACSLHENILKSAVALMHSRMESSIPAFQIAACEMLDALRDAVSGRPVTLPVFQTFSLIELPEDCEIPFKNSGLLAVPRLFLKHIPRDVHPAANTQDSPVVGCMLKMNCDFKVELFSNDTEPDFSGDWPLEISSDRILELCEDVYLGIALAVDGDINSGARGSANIRVDPLRGVHHSWRSVSSGGSDGNSTRTYQFNSAECERLEQYLKFLSVQDTEPIKMAKTRLASAVIDRALHSAGAQDSLVDAVIGLENLFGGGPEISFSLATGVSKLLGQSIEERNQIFAETKNVYAARSNVVHGNSIQKDVSRKRELAVSLLRRSIVKILEEKPELLQMKSKDRVKMLALS